MGPSRFKSKKYLSVVSFVSFVLLFCGSGIASSFPFRVVAEGDTVPPLTFNALSDGSPLTVESLRGNPAAIIFWGADIDTKKERSIKTFEATGGP